VNESFLRVGSRTVGIPPYRAEQQQSFTAKIGKGDAMPLTGAQKTSIKNMKPTTEKKCAI